MVESKILEAFLLTPATRWSVLEILANANHGIFEKGKENVRYNYQQGADKTVTVNS